MSKQKNNAAGSARDALRQRQAAQAEADKRAKTTIRIAWIAGLVVIAAMVGTIAWAFLTARSNNIGVPGADGVVAPSNATEAGGVIIGNADATVTVTVYADFMCPYCGQFERVNGSALAEAVDSGKAKLEIHPMAFLDESSGGTKFSTRAANAFVTLANEDPATALKFHQLVFANQPAEGSTGLTDAQLIDFAQQAGASAEVTATFAKLTFAPWVQQITNQAFSSGITGTPTVKINGTVFKDLYTAGPLAAAIDKAANA